MKLLKPELPALVIFLLAGGLDEYVYHRHIPEEETDLHAKGHLGLLIFVVVSIVTQWLVLHDWKVPNVFAG